MQVSSRVISAFSRAQPIWNESNYEPIIDWGRMKTGSYVIGRHVDEWMQKVRPGC